MRQTQLLNKHIPSTVKSQTQSANVAMESHGPRQSSVQSRQAKYEQQSRIN